MHWLSIFFYDLHHNVNIINVVQVGIACTFHYLVSYYFSAKEIAMNDPNKGRRIKLPAVRPSSLLKNAARSSTYVSNPSRTLSSPVEFAPVKQSPTIPSQTSAFSMQPTAPSPVAGKTATTGVVSSLPSGSAGASSLKPLTSSATVINYPYR